MKLGVELHVPSVQRQQQHGKTGACIWYALDLTSSFVPLQYIGRIFASKAQRFADLYALLLKRAGLPEGTKLSIYEEIKFDPTVMVDLQNPSNSLANAQLEDGDILCLQEQPIEVTILLCRLPCRLFKHAMLAATLHLTPFQGMC